MTANFVQRAQYKHIVYLFAVLEMAKIVFSAKILRNLVRLMLVQVLFASG